MFRRIWSLVIKEFIHLRNDWWLPAFMIIGGASELLLVGWATSRPINNLPIMVLDHDRSPASRALMVSLENTGTFRQPEYVSDMSTIEDALVRGQINAAVVIPPDFDEQMTSPTGEPTLVVILNGAERSLAACARDDSGLPGARRNEKSSRPGNTETRFQR